MAPKRSNPYAYYIPRSTKYARTTMSYVPNATQRNNRRARYRYFRSSSSRSGGPYRALVAGNMHQHPRYPAPEVKYTDQTQTGAFPDAVPVLTPLPSTGAVVVLNDLAISSGTNGSFTGNQVMTKSCAYRFEVALPEGMSVAPVPTSGRVCLVWDKQPNNATAAWTDIFAQATYLSFTNMSNRERFVVLRNQQFSLSPQGDETLFFEGFCNINMLSTFTTVNTGSNPTIPYTGALLVAYISDQVTADNQPTLTGTWRVRYIDN